MSSPNVVIHFKSNGQEGLDAMSKSLDGIKVAMGGLTEATKSYHKSIAAIKSPIDNFIHSQFKLNQVFEGFSRLKQSFDHLVAPAIAFDAAQKQLQATTGVTNNELKELGAFARLAGKELGATGAEVLSGMEKIANGIEITQIGGVAGLKKLTYQVSKFAIAANVDFATAANAVVGAKGQFGLGANEIGRAMNVMAKASQKGSAEAQNQMDSFRLMGTIAGDAGIGIEESASALDLLASVGLKGSEAGTQLRNIIGGLKKEGYDLSNGGFVTALKSLNGDLDDFARLEKLAGRDGVAGLKVLIKQADAVRQLGIELTNTNAANEIADVKMSSIAQSIANAKSWVDDLLVSFGGYFAKIAGWVEGLSALGQAIFAVSQITIVLAESYKVLKAVEWAARMESIKNTFAKIAEAYATVGLTGANGALAVSFRALTAAMAANPITAILIAIVALGAALYACWEKFDWFRGGVYALFEGVKMYFDYIVGIFKVLGGIITLNGDLISKGVDQFKSAFDFTRFGKAYDEGVSDFKQEKEKEKEDEKIVEDQKKNLADLKQQLNGGGVAQTSGSPAVAGTAPAASDSGLPSMILGGSKSGGGALGGSAGNVSIGTGGRAGGELITGSGGGGTSNNTQNITIKSVIINLTTVANLAQTVKEQVIKGIAAGLNEGANPDAMILRPFN